MDKNELQLTEAGREFKKAVKSLLREERPKGKWIKGYRFPDGNYWKCDNCNELIKVSYPMKYCSNCGADMRGSEVASNDIDNY